MKKIKGNDAKSETVLFVVLGVSPSVLTETVWALAHESPSIVPDRVIVLTTCAGRDALKKALFDSPAGRPGGWQRLVRVLKVSDQKLHFGLAADHVRLFPRPDGTGDLDDIATSADSDAAADFMLRQLREFTEDPSTRVLASLAGGRKTMGALLMSCLSLLGRKQDRLLHVLVNPPFDTPLDPPFLFPERGARHSPQSGGKLVPGAKTVRGVDARIELITVPFARMRGWYEKAFRSVPPSYMTLVAGVQRQAPEARVNPVVVVDGETGTLCVGDKDCPLNPTEFAAVSSLLRLFAASTPVTGLDLVIAQMRVLLLLPQTPTLPAWVNDFRDATQNSVSGCDYRTTMKESGDQVRRYLSSARQKLRKYLTPTDQANALLPDFRGPHPTPYPAKRIKIENWPR